MIASSEARHELARAQSRQGPNLGFKAGIGDEAHPGHERAEQDLSPVARQAGEKNKGGEGRPPRSTERPEVVVAEAAVDPLVPRRSQRLERRQTARLEGGKDDPDLQLASTRAFRSRTAAWRMWPSALRFTKPGIGTRSSTDSS